VEFSGKVGNGPLIKWSNFGGDQDMYEDTGKTCLGGGMHCTSASIVIPVFSLKAFVLLATFVFLLSVFIVIVT